MFNQLLKHPTIIKPTPMSLIPHPMAKQLKLAWLFNERAGTAVNDLSRQGRHGTLTGMAESTAWQSGGKYGSGLRFDGSNDYIASNIVTNTIFSTLNYGTVIASFKGEGAPQAAAPTDAIRFCKHIVDLGNRQGGIVRGSTTGDGEGIFVYLFTGGGEKAVEVLDAQDLDVTIGMTWDGTTLSAYRNGTLAGTIASAGPSGLASNFSVGGEVVNNVNYFTGIVNYVLVWDRVLDVGEMQMHYIDPFGMFSPLTLRGSRNNYASTSSGISSSSMLLMFS